MKTLSNISTIQSGFTFREAVFHDPEGDVNIIQAKDIHDGSIHFAELPKVQGVSLRATRLTGNIVLLSARGSFRAAACSFAEPAVAASSLYVIWPDDAQADPEFLSLYLNSPVAQAYFAQNSTGSSIKTLLIGTLRNLPVPDVPLDRQAKIVRLRKNQQQQHTILERRIAINQAILTELITTASQGAAA